MNRADTPRPAPDYVAEVRRQVRRDDRTLALSLAAATVIAIGGVTALNLLFG